MKLFVASQNTHKVQEIQETLSAFDLDFEVKSLKEFPDYQAPEETGETFVENARIKAEALKNYLSSHEETQDWMVLADDSGLECEDLNGEPGVYSARFAGPNATDADNNQKLVECFQNQTHATRAAQYVCCLVVMKPTGEELHLQEVCQGHIVLEPKGKNGFGYDPYFYLEELDKTMAELLPQEKNKISHRGKALLSLVKEFKMIL